MAQRIEGSTLGKQRNTGQGIDSRWCGPSRGTSDLWRCSPIDGELQDQATVRAMFRVESLVVIVKLPLLCAASADRLVAQPLCSAAISTRTRGSAAYNGLSGDTQRMKKMNKQERIHVGIVFSVLAVTLLLFPVTLSTV